MRFVDIHLNSFPNPTPWKSWRRLELHGREIGGGRGSVQCLGGGFFSVFGGWIPSRLDFPVGCWLLVDGFLMFLNVQNDAPSNEKE